MNDVIEPVQTDQVSMPQQQLSEARSFPQWMFDSIRSFVKGSTLEVASGTSTMADFFLHQGMPLYLSDYDSRNCQHLKARFGAQSLIKGIFHVDLGHADFNNRYPGLIGRLSTVLILNGVESRQNQAVALTNAKLLLRQRGHLIIVVPASTALYHGVEEGITDWKKENHKSLKQLLSGDFDILKTSYFNLVGIMGRWSSGSMFHNNESLPGQSALYDSLVPIFRSTDSSAFHHTGLSLIVIARKK